MSVSALAEGFAGRPAGRRRRRIPLAPGAAQSSWSRAALVRMAGPTMLWTWPSRGPCHGWGVRLRRAQRGCSSAVWAAVEVAGRRLPEGQP